MAKEAEQNKPILSTFKKTVDRSNAYPAHSIDYAFDLTKKIYLQFGSSTHNSRETIAKVLKMSANYLIIPLSTSSQYGLLEMKTKMGYNPTPLFLKLYKPESEEERRSAQLECIKNPKLYAALFDAYKGNFLPTSQALATTLFRRYNISENASLKAAEIFIDNLKALSLLNDDNKLIDFDLQEGSKGKNNSQTSFEPHPGRVANNVQNIEGTQTFSATVTDLSMGIKLTDGRKATLIYPEDITANDWNKIVRVIDAMKED